MAESVGSLIRKTGSRSSIDRTELHKLLDFDRHLNLDPTCSTWDKIRAGQVEDLVEARRRRWGMSAAVESVA